MNMPSLKEAKKRTNKEVLTEKYQKNDEYKRILKEKTFYIKTYGCQMNEHDSENMMAILKEHGMRQVEDYEDADLIMLNTCSIRENAHNKVFGMLGRIKHLKGIKKDIVVGLTGCMAQEEVVANEILNKYKWMDFVLGTHNIHKLPEIVAESFKERKLKIEAQSIEGDIIEDMPADRQSKYKAYASIDDDSTKLFEDILNDTIFDGYNNYGQSYSIIKEDDSIIGFKTINNIGGATVEYIFENQTDDVSSECYYYADNFMKYSVYLEGSNGFWERFYFIYDLTNKKFVTDGEVEYYVYNIETKEFEFIDTDTLPLREDFENPFIIMTVRKLSKIYSYQIQF